MRVASPQAVDRPTPQNGGLPRPSESMLLPEKAAVGSCSKGRPRDGLVRLSSKRASARVRSAARRPESRRPIAALLAPSLPTGLADGEGCQPLEAPTREGSRSAIW